MKPILRQWLPLACVITVLFAALYVIPQQLLRQSYNWPQIDAVNEASSQLRAGQSEQSVLSQHVMNAPIDRTGSLFVMLYDENGQPTEGSGRLDGNLPAIPYGVLLSSNVAPTVKNITWAPRADVRIAASIQKINLNNATRYVVAGRNLAQPEQLVGYLLLLVAISWLVSLCGSLGVVSLLVAKRRLYHL